MLRVVPHVSAGALKQYFAEGLVRGDYYSEGQEVVGQWHGRAAAMLGLEGDVTPEAFAALAENRHPAGGKLTPRNRKNRTVAYDLTFNAPKSLSVLLGITNDERIVTAFRAAVRETMVEVEAQMDTRVRKGRTDGNRFTGNFAWAEFVHYTARPVNQVPDVHLHVHAVAFNATFDPVEERWKAGMFRAIKKNAPQSEATFHARLAAKMIDLGYEVERTKNGWEIAGIPKTVLAKFSRRTSEIEALAKRLGITDPAAKDALGASSRSRKRQDLSKAELREEWMSRLTAEERAAVFAARKTTPSRPRITAAEAIDYALEKLLTKSSVAERGRVLSEAVKFGVGAVTPEAAKREFENRDLIIRKRGEDVVCTTLSVLAEELGLINQVRNGRGKFARIGKSEASPRLSREQQAAVNHVLMSRDQVIAVVGGAGVGKTTLMKEVATGIQKKGLKVFAFAPSAAASRETLREAGFANADTVARLLVDRDLQAEIAGQVIWVDEAGLLGTRDLLEVLRIAGNKTRVILTGDSNQHGPVSRGDAFRILERHAGLKIARVTQIRRQEVDEYRKAVASLSKGDLRNAFRRLDEIGAIKEIEDEGLRHRALAEEFMALSNEGRVPLVVSPTRRESELVTQAIRDAKREAGGLGEEFVFPMYEDLRWEEVDRRRAENYQAGLLVQFHQNCPGIVRGELFRVAGNDAAGNVEIVNYVNGRHAVLPLKLAKRFQVFQERRIRLGKGDRIRITRNGTSVDKKRLNNGNVFTVDGITKKGQIALSNGALLNSDHGHITYGYCQTSHSSQSKSVRDVLIAQSSQSFIASSREQFYVSVSRGKETVRIFTDSRSGLQEAVGNSSHRLSAIEFSELRDRDVSRLMKSLNNKEWSEALEERRKVSAPLKSKIEKALDSRGWQSFIQGRRRDGAAPATHEPAPAVTKKGRLAQATKAQENSVEHFAAVEKRNGKTADKAKDLRKASQDRMRVGKPEERPVRPVAGSANERAVRHRMKVKKTPPKAPVVQTIRRGK